MMAMENIAAAPRFPVPKDFLLRNYKSGDADNWLTLHREADQHNQFSETTFQTQFDERWEELPVRQLYVEKDGEVVATSTAWVGRAHWQEPAGRLHWVAVAPKFQNRGIGRALISATLDRLEELGDVRAYLTTSTIRPVAIKLYLDFGFAPVIRSDEEFSTWSALSRAPKLKELLAPVVGWPS
jgi:GNAT superfamily N-acetyltransferase